MSALPTRQRLPLDLRIVAFLFLLTGIFGWIDLFAENTDSHFELAFGVLGIPIFFGLLQLRPGWRTCAAILNAIALIFMIVALVLGAVLPAANFHFDLFGKPLTAISQASFLTIACGWLILFIWIQTVLAKSKPLFFAPESSANRHLSSFPAKRVLKWTIIAAIFSYVGIFVNRALIHTEGSSKFFGLAGTNNATDRKYFQTVLIDFRKFLEENGFQRITDQPASNFQIVALPLPSGGLAECFEGSYKGSPKFTVFMTPQKDTSGLLINYHYLLKDYKWRLPSEEKKIDDFWNLISDWWNDYQKLHPFDKIAG